MCAEQVAIIAALEQRAAVEIEGLHDATLSLVDGIGDVRFGECNSQRHMHLH